MIYYVTVRGKINTIKEKLQLCAIKSQLWDIKFQL